MKTANNIADLYSLRQFTVAAASNLAKEKEIQDNNKYFSEFDFDFLSRYLLVEEENKQSVQGETTEEGEGDFDRSFANISKNNSDHFYESSESSTTIKSTAAPATSKSSRKIKKVRQESVSSGNSNYDGFQGFNDMYDDSLNNFNDFDNMGKILFNYLRINQIYFPP
jgi:hypothetical protein